MKKVVVGISGGIDSFVTVLLLQQQGYQVIGAHLELWGKTDEKEVQYVCDTLRIPLICRDGRQLFHRVIVKPFVEAYLSALTPSPCCICNSFVKWELLRQIADECNAPYIATGHYVRMVRQNEHTYIAKGVDPQKDQSYFLWGVPQDILKRALTPLGDYTKMQVREWALDAGYERMVKKRESMGICFLEGKDYREFIRQHAESDGAGKPGDILDRDGKVIGQHHGLLNYTIGQKRDIPLRQGQPLYVAEIDKQQNVIIADIKSGLRTMSLKIGHTCIVCPADLQAADITVKVRGIGLNPVGFARIEQTAEGRLNIHLSDPAWAVAPGQPVALYRGDLLIGGGIAEN